MILIMERQEKMREVFKWAAENSGFGQVRIAEIIGCSQPNVSQLMRKCHYVKSDYLEKLAVAMGKTVGDLVAGYENDPFREQPEKKIPARRTTDTGNRVELSDHQVMVTRFKDPERGKEINELLLKIEELAPEVLDELRFTLEKRLEYLRGSQSSPKPAQQDKSSTS